MRRYIEFPWRILIGLLLGLGAGLLIAWVFVPVEYTDTDPASLRADFKEQYRLVIASAYSAGGDLARAQARLSLLGDLNPAEALSLQADVVRNNGDAASAALLADLAFALKNPPSQTAPVPTSVSLAGTPADTAAPTATDAPTITPLPSATLPAPTTPLATLVPRPTRVPSSTPGAAFALTSADVICNPDAAPGLLQVVVLDAANQPAPGIEVIINWSGNEEHFFTGLKPDLGNGYADFIMTPGTVYTLRLAAGSNTVTDLAVPNCQQDNGSNYDGGIKLIFKQQ
jgi:hypothetical protein